MRDAPLGAQRRRGDHRMHQLVGVQAALHQHLDLAGGGQLGGAGGGGVAVLDRLDARVAQIQPGLLGQRADLRLRADQPRHDQAAPGGGQRAGQRGGVAGMHHAALHRRLPGQIGRPAVDPACQPGVGVEQVHLRQRCARPADLLQRRAHQRLAADDGRAGLVRHHAVQRQAVALDVACGHDRLGGQRVAGAHRQVKAQRLALVDRAGAGKLGAQQRGDHRAGPHAMRDRAVEAGRVGIFRVDMGRVHIARDQREGDDVVLRQRAADAGPRAHGQLVEGEVGDRFGRRDRVHGGLRASGRQVVGALAREAGISAPHGSRRRRRASGRSCRVRPVRPGRPPARRPPRA